MMSKEQAERLLDNQDFQAFLQLLNEDAEQIKEDLVLNPLDDFIKTQVKIQTIRSVAKRLGHLIDELSPEQPASDQDTAS